jgi:hypothetical protein
MYLFDVRPYLIKVPSLTEWVFVCVFGFGNATADQV